MGHYHLGIKKDTKRNAIPIQAVRIAGVTFHHRTASYDREQGDYLHKAGQLFKLEPAQVEAIKAALRVDRAPADIDRSVNDKSEFKDARAEKYRAVEKATGIGSSYKTLDYRDVVGFGKVVQWSEQKDDKGKTEWLSRVLDLSDRDYQPTERPEDEVPLSTYIFLEEKGASDFNPPAIDLGSDDAANAAGIEREEEKRDPAGFEKTKKHQERRKAGLEVHAPGA